MIHVVFPLASTPSRDVLEAFLEALAEADREWYLLQWEKYRDPPRSALDAGVRWQPDRPDVLAVFQDAPTVFNQGVASCGPIAAISVGHARARDQVRGSSRATVRAHHRVELRPDPTRRASWHAYHAERGRLLDPTRGMMR